MQDQLKQLIEQSTHLQPMDKEFLIASLPQLDRLESLKLQQNLLAGNPPVLLGQLQTIRTKYHQSQVQQQTSTDPISKFVEKLVPKKERKPVSLSIFSKPSVLGSKTPIAVTSSVVAPTSLQEISDPAQLKFLTPAMVDDLGQDGFEQKFSKFSQNITELFNKIGDLEMKRNYFLTYMQSPLFSAYISSGLTAMKHEELKPRKISLNLLYQLDQKYLNARQFKTTALITYQLRSICVL